MMGRIARPRASRSGLSICLTVLGLLPAAMGAQTSDAVGGRAAFADPTAARLYDAAVAHRERRDDSVLRYTAVVRQRIAVALRTPLKDRTLYRVESSHRVFWSRDDDMLVQVLALREQTPAGVSEAETHQGLFDHQFDPMNDRLLFGFAEDEDDMGEREDDDFWFEHPLFREYAAGYRFASGDTLTLSLPDGRSVRAIELQVVPHVADVHRMTGSLWIEPETGALVRAAYRLADTFDAFRDTDLSEEEDEDLRWIPGLFKPWTVELKLIAVDYALWDFGVWLPRSMRVEGVVSAGILKAPATIDIGYRMESVLTTQALEEDAQDGLREVRFRTRDEAFAYLSELSFGEEVPYVLEPGSSEHDGRRVRYLVPEDPSFLTRSPELPPPVWEDAPGFASDADIEEVVDRLAALPTPSPAQVPHTFRWGAQRPDLLRYNRVEALSVGARGQLRPMTLAGPLSVTATARLGIGDLEPNGHVELSRETLQRRVSLHLFHELAAVDEDARHLGIGNSILAATIGRDDGDYYRRSGAALEWQPPTAERRSFRVRGYAEHHRRAAVETDFALFHIGADTWSFRDNIVADEGWEYGALVELTPWWGTDPNMVQAGLDLTLQAATGDLEYARAALLGRLAIPLPADLRLALEAGAGTSAGGPPAQRLWYLGGPSTLRGYEPRAQTGESFGRARAALARASSFGSVSVFSDFGWAGPTSDFIRFDDGLHSVGAGLSILDGLIRFDAAWGLSEPRDFRIDLYLDAIL